MAAKVISFINLKGGVGKTTLALTVGEFLSTADWRWRGNDLTVSDPKWLGNVLMVDMDSQSNLSYALVSGDELNRLRREGKSTYHLFHEALRGNRFDVKGAILSQCSNVERHGSKRLHVLISCPDLAQFDEELLEFVEQGNPIPTDLRLLLKQALDPLRDDYDYIIIDCPPSLSMLTSSVIMASDYYVVPIVPEKLSTLGLELIQFRIGELKNRYPEEVSIEFAGTILNKVDIRRKDHRETYAEMVYVDEKDRFHPFHWWLGDIRPLYLVTDFELPVQLHKSPWFGLYAKYTYGAKRRKMPTGILGRDDGYDQYDIFERLRRLTGEVVERCR